MFHMIFLLPIQKTMRCNHCLRLLLIKITMARITGVNTIVKARRILGFVISGKMMLPYFIRAAPATEPPPSFHKYFKSSCSQPKKKENFSFFTRSLWVFLFITSNNQFYTQKTQQKIKNQCEREREMTWEMPLLLFVLELSSGELEAWIGEDTLLVAFDERFGALRKNFGEPMRFFFVGFTKRSRFGEFE